jgi:hypothetical protein
MNACGHPYSSEIHRYVSKLGVRSEASISRHLPDQHDEDLLIAVEQGDQAAG